MDARDCQLLGPAAATVPAGIPGPTQSSKPAPGGGITSLFTDGANEAERHSYLSRSQGKRGSGPEPLLLPTVPLNGTPATYTQEIHRRKGVTEWMHANTSSHSVKMANVKRCSTALVIKEMQIKLRCHFLPINLAKIFF